jgi:hypothetical protein
VRWGLGLLLTGCVEAGLTGASAQRLAVAQASILPPSTTPQGAVVAASVVDLDGDGGLDAVQLHHDGLSHEVVLRVVHDVASANPQIEEQELARSRVAPRLALGDLNGDSRVDAVVGGDAGAVVLLDVDAGGAPQELRSDLAIPGVVYALSVADIDRDGLDDVVSSSNDGAAGQRVDVWFGADGQGGLDVDLVVATSVVAGQQPRSVLADMNGDGAADLVTWSFGPLELRLAAGRGFGPVSAAWLFPSRIGAELVRVADADGDGDEEVALRYESRGAAALELTGTLMVWHGDPVAPAEPQVLPDPGGSATLASADINEDGFADVITAGTGLRPGFLAVMGGPAGLVPAGARVAPAPAGSVNLRVRAAAPGWVLATWTDGLEPLVDAVLPVVPDAADADGDGWGAGLDPDDTRPEAWPGAPEIFGNGLDDDGDGWDRCALDLDGDGFPSSQITDAIGGCTLRPLTPQHEPLDCDDEAPGVHPGMIELPGESVDRNCDGLLRCFSDADEDGDGFLAEQAVTLPNDADCDDPGESYGDGLADCDDTHPDVNPGAMDPPGDAVDADCDGLEVCFVDGDQDGARSRRRSAPEVAPFCTRPGVALGSAPLDCDDASATIGPGQVELPDDGVDQDCDGQELCFADRDGDGLGNDRGVTVVSADLACDGLGEGPAVDPDDRPRDEGIEPGQCGQVPTVLGWWWVVLLGRRERNLRDPARGPDLTLTGRPIPR